jgi:simple sugar transport system permease protein
VIVAADIRGADANNAGLWLELDAILAVVIGGGSLMGGRFNLLLSVIGFTSVVRGLFRAPTKPSLRPVVSTTTAL